MRSTFPRLRMIAADRDVTLTELDLRWGITQEESESGKVVEICLDEIEHSVPFFIGIVGNRYGWVPKRQELDEIVYSKYHSVSEYVERKLSVTEMEIQFGVLERANDMHAYFFIKEDSEEKPDAPEKLALLKHSIIENKRYPVSFYDCIETLSEQVEEAFLKLLDQLFPEKKVSELEKERISQRSFLNQQCVNYIRNNDYFVSLDSWLQDWTSHYFVVSGESGLGKSALIANWIREKLDDSKRNYNIIYHFVGNGGSLGEKSHIVKYLVDEIKDLYGYSTEKDQESEEQLQKLILQIAASRQRLLIILDAINQLADVDFSKQLRWLPSAAGNIKILFSTLPADSTMAIFRNRSYPSLEITCLTKCQKSSFISGYLHNSYGKKLSEEQQRKIVTASVTSNTLVLSTLLDEIIRYGKYNNLDDVINEYINVTSVEHFYHRLLRRYEELLSTDLFGIFLMHIAVSRYGLKESEIIQLTKCAPLRWSEFYAIFRRHLVTKNGVLSFGHEYLRKVVQRRYLDTMPDVERNIRINISTHLNSDFRRNCEEIPYQDYILGNYEALYRTLIRPNVFYHYYEQDEDQLELYWKVLTEHGYHIQDYMSKVLEEDSVLFAHQLSYFCSHFLHDSEAALLFAEQTARIYDSRTSNKDKTTLFRIYMDIAASYYDAAQYSKAIEERKKALDYLIESKTDDDELYAEIYLDMSQDYYGLDDYNGSLKYTELALEYRKKVNGTNDPLTGICYNNLGMIYGKLGLLNEALECTQRALSIRKETFGEHFGPTIVSYCNLGLCHSNLGDNKNALKQYNKALKLALSTFGPVHAELIDIYTNIGTEYHNISEFKKASLWYRRAYDTHVKVFGFYHIGTKTYLDALSSEYWKANQLGCFSKLEKQRLEYTLHVGGDRDDALPYIYNNLGVCYRRLGKYKIALEYAQKAVAASLEILGDGLDTAQIYDRLGQIYQGMNNVEKAEDAYRKALALFHVYDKERRFSKETEQRIHEIRKG